MEEIIQKQLYNDIDGKNNVYTNLKIQNKKVIKSIVFDLGGVFFTAGTPIAVERLKNIFKMKEYNLLKHLFSSEKGTEGELIRLGRITIDEFERRIIEKLNLIISQKHFIRELWFDSYVPNYKMEEIVKKLCRKYRLIVFSGNVRERVDYLNDKYDFLKYFDDFVFSFNYNLTKKDKGFYFELKRHLGEYTPEETLVIDDSKHVLEKAESLGFNVLRYTSTKQFIEDLNDFNINININFETPIQEI